MSSFLKESLSKLERLSANKLHETSQRLRGELGSAEWKLSLCLLASVRQGSYRKLGYATITEYAEKALQLSGKKAGCLLGTARALEHLPLLSEAFRLGKIGWGKLRAIRGLATPETERQWLAFAQGHHTGEVVRRVTLSPQSWKRHQALQASLDGKPTVSERQVGEVLRADLQETASSACLASATKTGVPVVASVPVASSSSVQIPVKPELPAPPQTIRLVIELTPDQYALYERAESRVRTQAQQRLSRAKVLTKMSEAVLNQGTARARAKHQVLIHTEPKSGRAWYDTQKGPLPVSPAIVEMASAQKPLLEIKRECSNVLPKISEEVRSDRSQPRKAIPSTTLREVFARAGHQCQRCGTRDALFDIHHTQPISEGGNNRIETLKVLCQPCHSLSHEADYATKPEWRAAKEARRGLSKAKRGSPFGRKRSGPRKAKTQV